MKKVIRKRIRYEKGGIQVAGDLDAVIATNTSKRGSSQRVSSRQKVSIRQATKKVPTSRDTGERPTAKGGDEHG
jgi:hypothetical protein